MDKRLFDVRYFLPGFFVTGFAGTCFFAGGGAGFPAGLAVLTLESVSGTILLGMRFPSLLGVSPLGAGANTPSHTPKPSGLHYTNMDIIEQREKKEDRGIERDDKNSQRCSDPEKEYPQYSQR